MDNVCEVQFHINSASTVFRRGDGTGPPIIPSRVKSCSQTSDYLLLFSGGKYVVYTNYWYANGYKSGSFFGQIFIYTHMSQDTSLV